MASTPTQATPTSARRPQVRRVSGSGIRRTYCVCVPERNLGWVTFENVRYQARMGSILETSEPVGPTYRDLDDAVASLLDALDAG